MWWWWRAPIFYGVCGSFLRGVCVCVRAFRPPQNFSPVEEVGDHLSLGKFVEKSFKDSWPPYSDGRWLSYSDGRTCDSKKWIFLFSGKIWRCDDGASCTFIMRGNFCVFLRLQPKKLIRSRFPKTRSATWVLWDQKTHSTPLGTFRPKQQNKSQTNRIHHAHTT